VVVAVEVIALMVPVAAMAQVLLANSVAATHDPRRYSADWPAALREETDRRRPHRSSSQHNGRLPNRELNSRRHCV
jgi:hypothetical protein